MSINFNGFEIGRRALNANQFGIDITGQNIANVHTPGYTRRSVQLAEATPQGAGSLTFGAGVDIKGIQAFRNTFLEGRIQAEIGIAGTLTATRDTLLPVEVALQGTEDSGLQVSIEEFFGSFRDLEANPESVPLRAVVVGKAESLASSFNTLNSRLDAIQQSADGQLRATVEEVNSLSEKIRDLNNQVRAVVNSDGDANGLIDQRTELVNDLSELAGVRVTHNDDSTINVTIGEGRPLVASDTLYTLDIVDTASGFAGLEIAGNPAIINEGTIRGYQNAISNIDDKIATLDGIAEQLALRVNALHQGGTDLDGNAGVEFFDTSTPVTARNLVVNTDIINNNRLIVSSPIPQPAESGTVAGQIANLLSDQNTSVGLRTGTFSSLYGALLSDAGDAVRDASNGLETQAAIIAQSTAQREQASGVSLDEEAINLLQYQKAFEAAARFIQVADEMTQTILSLAG